MPHSPSPWTIERPSVPVGSRKRPVIEVVSARGLTVATVRDENDAALIAAAPSMLKALYALAMLGLQSDRYTTDREFRDAVDAGLALTKDPA